MIITWNRILLITVLAATIAVILYSVLTMPDYRTTGQRVGDTIDALPEGADKAARQFEKRTPGEKLGDAIKDASSNSKQ